MIDKFCVPRRWSLLLASLMVVVLISSSCFVSVFSGGVSLFALGASATDKIVSNETELRDAVNNAQTGKSMVITLDRDITLTNGSLIIPPNKDITLTSNKATGFYKLIGTPDKSAIVVDGSGVLRLDGIIVTHKTGAINCGVYVQRDGMFYLYSGTISGNTADKVTFSGGGVFNAGSFVMSGGTISGNTADSSGGGVHNSGSFVMSGGTISGNTADSSGGGVYNGYSSSFTMSGGKITGNTANFGGGVYVYYDKFTMTGGEISGNTALKQGGGVYNTGVFVMLSGTISGNTAGGTISGYDIGWGGGVYSYNFTMSGGKITDNVADLGGGVFWRGGIFDRSGGTISDNTASKGNADVYHYNSSDSSDEANGGTSNGDNGTSINGFSLRDVVIACVITASVTLCLVIVILRISSQKRFDQVEKIRV
jgi:hypothetical protein